MQSNVLDKSQNTLIVFRNFYQAFCVIYVYTYSSATVIQPRIALQQFYYVISACSHHTNTNNGIESLVLADYDLIEWTTNH